MCGRERRAPKKRRADEGIELDTAHEPTGADNSSMEKKRDGLVICPKTCRSELEQDLIDVAQEIDHENLGQGGGHYLVLSPGSVRVKRRGTKKQNANTVPSERKPITSWSRKSRANMVARFSSLDLTPLSEPRTNALAVMITLTYPKDWESLVPTAYHAKKHLHQFRKRFERRFGRPLFAMWKAEFQRRGAVHFHLFTVCPTSLAVFREWVASTWTEIVAPTPESERQKHLKAGTAVDLAPGATIDNARLVAVYFSKHSSANFGAKEYQNSPPQKWIEAGSVGRFWGYWHLRPVEAEAQITEQEAIAVARLLRRWFHSKGFTRVERVVRVNEKGTVTFRRVRRRSRRMSQSYGFITLGDSLGIAKDVSRFLSLIRD